MLDAPLLFETKILEYFCYPIVVVYCFKLFKEVVTVVHAYMLRVYEFPFVLLNLSVKSKC